MIQVNKDVASVFFIYQVFGQAKGLYMAFCVHFV